MFDGTTAFFPAPTIPRQPGCAAQSLKVSQVGAVAVLAVAPKCMSVKLNPALLAADALRVAQVAPVSVCLAVLGTAVVAHCGRCVAQT
jgi:hypothetical protein